MIFHAFLLMVYSVCVFCHLEPLDSEDVSDLSGDYCGQKWSCAVPEIDDRNCKCDSSCALYNDCCGDANVTNLLYSSTPNFNCEYIKEIDLNSYIYIVRTCPLGTRRDLRQACEDTTDISIPVSGIRTGYTYRNMFCAACHQEEFFTWQVGYSCDWRYKSMVNFSKESLQNDKDCSKIFQPPSSAELNYEARKCFPVLDSCALDYHAAECKNGKTALVFDDHVYKNINCVLCNLNTTENVTCSWRTWKLRPSGQTRRTVYSYRLLFDFHSGEATGTYKQHFRIKDQTKVTKTCPYLEVFDPFSDMCRKASCLFPLVFDNGRCIYVKRNESESKGISRAQKECVYVKLNDTEYEIVNETNIFIYSINKLVMNNVYFHEGDNTYVCKKELQDSTNRSSPSSSSLYSASESTLSLVGSILSISALIITLVLYLRFPKLRNVPGKSLICMMLSLITAQLLFLFAYMVEDFRHACISFAVIIHYAFLASVFWMNCMSLDIFITFSKGFVKSDEDEGHKKFLWYSVYSWLSPMLIILLGVCLDLYTENDYRPMYGETVCWIGNKRAILVFFLVPISLLVAANLFFYTFTVRSICLSNRQSSRILKRKTSCKVLIYLKLSIVMGLTWVFAYVASLSNELVFWYLFIFFSSWQGVFIFISFVCFGKVRGQVVDRVRQVSSYFQSRTQSTHLSDLSKT